MPFEVFTPEAVAGSKPAYVSIQKQGIVSLNRAAFLQLGEPKAVELLYDRDRRLVGLRGVDATVKHAQRVRTTSNGRTYLVSAARFMRHYGIPTDVSRRWVAALERNVLFIDLDKPGVN